jgi:hypothetical protein
VVKKSAPKKPRSEKLDRVDLLGITFVKCARGKSSDFAEQFHELIAKQEVYRPNPARSTDRKVGIALPFALASSAGYFDYLVLIATNSSYALSKFCEEVLRKSPDLKVTSNGARTKTQKHLGDCVIDTHSTIGIFYGTDEFQSILKRWSDKR